MRKVGLVGGIGPESTLDYYRGINQGYRQRSGLEHNPPMIIDSLNLAEMYQLASNQQWPAFADRLVFSIQNLVAGGAQFAAMAANTAHIVFEEVQQRSTVPLISIVEETCRFAQNRNCRRVVVFGTAFTMKSGLYCQAFASKGIEAFVPSDEDQQTIHGIIFPHLQEGLVLPQEKEAILRIAQKMISRENADGLVLACTELPLIIQPQDLDVAMLDTTQIHIDAIVEGLLA